MVGTILSISNEISKIKISEIHLEVSVQSMFKIVSLLNEIYKTYQTHLYLMYTS